MSSCYNWKFVNSDTYNPILTDKAGEVREV